MSMRNRFTRTMQGRIAALARWLACAACLLVLCAACARNNCPGCTLADPLPIGCPYAASNLAPTYTNPMTPDPTMLILSGGGSYGAWGAGVITGWPSTPVPRPRFTVVTGISTGALQATPAFLGTAQSDAQLTSFFTTSTNSDIYTTKWNFMFSDSLQSREPLRQIIHDNVTDAVVDAVAAETDRELFVGTVNLDTSQFCPWNLSTIAHKAHAAKLANDTDTQSCYVRLFRKAIFAASGAPVITPPVEIDSNACTGLPPRKMLHVDGGVRLRVFVAKLIDDAIQAGKHPTAYVIMNGKLATHPECVEDSLAPIAMRTFEIMDHESLYGSLYALMYGRDGKFDLKLSRVPDQSCLTFPSSEFDPPKLLCLYQSGKAWVQQTTDPWETKLPVESAAAWPAGCCSTALKCAGRICLPSAGCPP